MVMGKPPKKKLIIERAHQYRVIAELHRGAADVDRILKGEKPAELPVQAPTK